MDPMRLCLPVCSLQMNRKNHFSETLPSGAHVFLILTLMNLNVLSGDERDLGISLRGCSGPKDQSVQSERHILKRPNGDYYVNCGHRVFSLSTAENIACDPLFDLDAR